LPVKISSENGYILPGDRLTFSSLAGYAMKANDGDTNVGIALEAFSSPDADRMEILSDGKVISIGRVLAFINVNDKVAETGFRFKKASTTIEIFGTLDLQGNEVKNIKSLEGVAALWKIDENGNIYAEEIFAKKVTTANLELGSDVNPSGFTIYDEATKQPYCIKMINGALTSFSGKCGSESAMPTVIFGSSSSASPTNNAAAIPSEPIPISTESTPNIYIIEATISTETIPTTASSSVETPTENVETIIETTATIPLSSSEQAEPAPATPSSEPAPAEIVPIEP